MPLNREDDLHLTSLAAGAQVFIPPNPLASPRAIAPQALTPRDASTIFGEIARFGYSSLQQVPGGVRIASGDGVSVLNLTGTGWEFTEDLSRSLFEPAIEKMAVSIRAYLDRPAMAGAIMLPQTVDLQAVWENLGEAADEHIAARFLSDQARLVVGGIAGVNFNGAGIRLSLLRPWSTSAPPGFMLMQGTEASAIDVRIEPLFADKSKLFLEVTGVFGPPTSDLDQVTTGARFLREVLWEHVARNIQMEV